MTVSKQSEKRRPILCPNCAGEMVSMNKFVPASGKVKKGIFVWYVCPSRKGEKGCGYCLLMEISEKSKNPLRTMAALQLENTLPVPKNKYKYKGEIF